jgi:Putative auto-transporter adhesin, head GIN domain
MKNIVLFTLLFGCLVACKKKIETKFVALENFKKIEINSSFDVVIVQDTENSLEIIGDSRFVKTVEFKIENEQLFLKRTGKKEWTHPKSKKLKLVIHVKELTFLKVNETSNVSSENALTGNEIGVVLTSKLNIVDLKVNCTTFYSWNNFPCSGSVKLHGNVTTLKLWIVALMAVDATQLMAQYALVESNTKGLIQINTANQLQYTIKGQGNIEVFGNPTTIQNLGGTGAGTLLIK